MSKLTTTQTPVPETFQKIFRQWARPWQLDDNFVDSGRAG